MSRRTIITYLLATSLALTGCHTCRRQEFISNRPACDSCGDAAPRLKQTPLPPYRQPPAQPPIASLGGPTPATYLEPSAPVPSQRQPERNDEAPPNPPTPDAEFPPAGPSVKLGPPRRIAPDRRTDVEESPRAEVPSPRKRAREDQATPRDDETARLLNVKNAIDGVYSGFAPDDVNHFRWLADNDFRAVLNLREDANDAEVKRNVIKNGMKYHGLTAPADRLTPEIYEQFVKAVNETKSHRLYVCDRDGPVAGALWYLYFRHQLSYSAADARREAKDLGLDFNDKSKINQDVLLAIDVITNLLDKGKDGP